MRPVLNACKLLLLAVGASLADRPRRFASAHGTDTEGHTWIIVRVLGVKIIVEPRSPRARFTLDLLDATGSARLTVEASESHLRASPGRDLPIGSAMTRARSSTSILQELGDDARLLASVGFAPRDLAGLAMKGSLAAHLALCRLRDDGAASSQVRAEAVTWLDHLARTSTSTDQRRH